jgi:hypothetical protein
MGPAMSAVISLIIFLHARFGIALLIFAALLGVWGTIAFATRRRISPGFRAAFVLMIALTAVQGLAGVVAFVTGNRPGEVLHIVYGIFAIVFLPGLYFLAARRSQNLEGLLMVASCWIVAIAFGRGIFTGG